MGQAVVHFQIGAVDDQAAVEFYSQLFSWTVTPVPGMPYHNVQTGSSMGIPGGISKVEHESEAVVTIFVEVDDVAESLAKAEALGAKIIMAAGEVMPGLSLGMFLDPQGRSIGLAHDARPRPAAAAAEARPTAKPAKKKASSKKSEKVKKDKKGKKGKKGKKKR